MAKDQTDNFSPWPQGNPFPQSLTSTVVPHQPDFPESAGTRELGKFRPSATPRLTTLAVANDDGSAIGSGQYAVSDEQTLLLRCVVRGLSILTGIDLWSEELGTDFDE